MTREEAVNWLKYSIKGVNYICPKEVYEMAIKALEQPERNAQERYEDLCEYFKDCSDKGMGILGNRKEFKAWLERLHWHVVRCDELGRELEKLKSAQPDHQEVLGWLLAYHTMSFDLHGRHLPHEVISWLINDFTKEFIAERRTDE